MRIRTIKPEFWTHPVITQLDDVAQLLALALLNYADDEGYFYADPDLVRGSLMPKRKSERIEKALETLSSQSVQYLEIRVHGTHGPIGRVLNFSKHQRVNRATGSALVAYYNSLSNHGGLTEYSLNTHGGLTEDSARERKGREGKGKEGKGIGCHEPSTDASRPASDVFLVFPTNKKGEGVQIFDTDVDRWQMLYQTVDVKAEVRKCLAWNEANPTRRKTSGGLHKHINGWLSKVHDKGGTPYHKPPDIAVQVRKQNDEEPSWYRQFMRDEYDMEDPKSWASLGQTMQAEFTTIHQSRVNQVQPQLATV